MNSNEKFKQIFLSPTAMLLCCSVIIQVVFLQLIDYSIKKKLQKVHYPKSISVLSLASLKKVNSSEQKIELENDFKEYIYYKNNELSKKYNLNNYLNKTVYVSRGKYQQFFAANFSPTILNILDQRMDRQKYTFLVYLFIPLYLMWMFVEKYREKIRTPNTINFTENTNNREKTSTEKNIAIKELIRAYLKMSEDTRTDASKKMLYLLPYQGEYDFVKKEISRLKNLTIVMLRQEYSRKLENEIFESVKVMMPEKRADEVKLKLLFINKELENYKHIHDEIEDEKLRLNGLLEKIEIEKRALSLMKNHNISPQKFSQKISSNNVKGSMKSKNDESNPSNDSTVIESGPVEFGKI